MYVESAVGDAYPEAPDQAARLRLAWERLRGAALSPEDSAALLAELSRE